MAFFVALADFQRLSASSLVNLFISNPPLLNYEHPNDSKDTDYF